MEALLYTVQLCSKLCCCDAAAVTDVALSAVMLLLLRDVVDVIAVEDFDECVVSLVAVADNICCCGVCKCCEHFVFFVLFGPLVVLGFLKWFKQNYGLWSGNTFT